MFSQAVAVPPGPHVARITLILGDNILLPCYQLYFFSSSLSFASISPLTIFFLPLMLITLFLALPFLFCTVKFLFHTVCHLDTACELCILLSLSVCTPLSLSSSFRPPFTNKVSVSITTTKRQSEKIWKDAASNFIFCFRSHSSLPRLSSCFFFPPVCSAWSMQSGIIWFFMWREWGLGWFGGCGERVIKALVCLNAFLLGLLWCVAIPRSQQLTNPAQSHEMACIGCDTTLCMAGHWKFQTCYI